MVGPLIEASSPAKPRTVGSLRREADGRVPGGSGQQVGFAVRDRVHLDVKIITSYKSEAALTTWWTAVNTQLVTTSAPRHSSS